MNFGCIIFLIRKNLVVTGPNKWLSLVINTSDGRLPVTGNHLPVMSDELPVTGALPITSKPFEPVTGRLFCSSEPRDLPCQEPPLGRNPIHRNRNWRP
jgi:hypothetical protein